MKTKNKALVALLSSFGFLSLAIAADPVPAAKVTRVEGNAIASQDARYLPAREGMALKEGDRLMVLDNSSAIVSFADGCQYTLKDMGVLVVQKTSTCALNGVGVYNFDPRTAVSSGKTPPLIQAQVIPAAPPTLPNSFLPLFPQFVNPSYLTPWWIPAGLGTTFVTVGIISANNSSNNEPPPSPIL